MNVVSAYLIRQVASGGGTDEYISNYIRKMKQAVTSGNLTAFIEDLHVILSPDGQLAYTITSTGRESNIYNPYTVDRAGEGWGTASANGRWAKGCSAIVNGEYGIAACLYYSEAQGWWSEIRSVYDSTLGDSLIWLNTCSRSDQHVPGEGLNWQTSDGADETRTWQRTTTLCTIPILASYEAAVIHIERVLRYCSSKQDSDLDDVESNMKNNLYDYEYESL